MPEPVFTTEQIAEDGRNRVARTTGQVTVPAALVVIGEWLAQEVGWDGNLETAVSGAMVVVLTSLAAYLVNRKKITGA